jgi:hypothetical protein
MCVRATAKLTLSRRTEQISDVAITDLRVAERMPRCSIRRTHSTPDVALCRGGQKAMRCARAADCETGTVRCARLKVRFSFDSDQMPLPADIRDVGYYRKRQFDRAGQALKKLAASAADAVAWLARLRCGWRGKLRRAAGPSTTSRICHLRNFLDRECRERSESIQCRMLVGSEMRNSRPWGTPRHRGRCIPE